MQVIATIPEFSIAALATALDEVPRSAHAYIQMNMAAETYARMERDPKFTDVFDPICAVSEINKGNMGYLYGMLVVRVEGQNVEAQLITKQ
jgi:hypothetical protein